MLFPRVGFAKRLLALYGIIFIIVLLVTDGTLCRFLQKRDLQQLQSSLLRQTVLIREIVTPLFKEGPHLQEEVSRLTAGTDVRITIIGPGGEVLADSRETSETLGKMDNHSTRPEVAAALGNKTGMSTRYSMTLKTRMLYIAIPVLENNTVLGVVRAAMPTTRVGEIVASVRQPIMLTALFGILIVVIFGMIFGYHFSIRIRRITSGAKRYAREDWSEKILIDGRDELRVLAETMNLMALKLQGRLEDLESEKEKLSVILAHMTEGVIAINHLKQFVLANPAAKKIFGFTTTSARGKSLIEISRHPQLEMIVDRALKDQKTVAEEIQISGKGKKTLRVNVIVLDAHVRDINAILVFYDMTELRRLENIRKEFVANVSHELRTPLTSIKGFIETLLGGALRDPPTSERFLKIMAEETSRLGRLVEDILTLGEIEQRATLLKKDRIDLATEVPAILEQFKTRLDEKKIVVEDRISRKPLVLSGDRDKIYQVFVNLIDNAIKFNKPEGRIVLTADQKAGSIAITIEDTGIGISEESLPRIFERFFRVDKARSRELGGTGLGLAIVKHIMEAHGGSATCQSQPGKGSVFTVSFPV